MKNQSGIRQSLTLRCRGNCDEFFSVACYGSVVYSCTFVALLTLNYEHFSAVQECGRLNGHVTTLAYIALA